jgi:hypothetical protein
MKPGECHAGTHAEGGTEVITAKNAEITKK